MSDADIGMWLGIGVIFTSFVCGIILIFNSMRNNPEEKKNEQKSSGMDQGNY